MAFALIVDGVVREIFAEQPELHESLQVEAAPDGAAAGWTWSAEAGFAAPPAPIVDLAAYAGAIRYDAEVAGIVVAGAPIKTDRQSQALITGAFALSQAVPGMTIEFKTGDGFVTLSADQVKAIAVAVGEHVQAAFAKEGEVQAQIASGAITTTAEIDAAFALI